jgi:hypothetical protein
MLNAISVLLELLQVDNGPTGWATGVRQTALHHFAGAISRFII